jgi:predicted nucleic acid-binding protein
VNVYVESNFVLELALKQEQHESCEQLVQLASAGSIKLVIPTFSLAEPHDALIARDKPRRKLGNDLKSHLDELGRSEQYRRVPDTFGRLAGTLLAAGAIERDGLRRALERILEVAEVIPLDADVLRSASELQQKDWDMPAKDLIVFASVVRHLEGTFGTGRCFLNRNTRDFDNPRVRRVLKFGNCKFFGSFDAGLAYIEPRISKPEA